MAGLPPFTGGNLADYLRLLSQQPAVQAQRVECTMADAAGAGQTTADVEHGLGRAYVDGWIGTQSDNVGLRLIDAETAEAAGVDVSLYARVQASASTTTTFVLWIM
jgi:hypothetical protein